MENPVDCTLDNLVIYVEDVHRDTWMGFQSKLDKSEYMGKIPPIRMTIGQGYSEYHYRLNIGIGSGAVTIGYKHNSAREGEEFYRMRVEFNPSKSSVLFETFWDMFAKQFECHTKLIKQVDLAFDVSVNISKVFAISLTGRQKAYYKSTQYFGSRGNTGRLKIYDKKTELEEKQGVTIIESDRTRIEYTYRFDEALTVQLFSKANTNINTEYEIVSFNEEKLAGDVKAAVLAIYHDFMKISEFTRTMNKKIKSAVASMEKFDLDHAYQSANKKIIKMITSYLNRL